MNDQLPGSKEQFISVPCNACGSEMTFDPGTQGLHCTHCGNRRELPRSSDRIIERSFSETFSLSHQPTGLDVETKLFHCNNCGSNTVVDPDVVSFTCPFCSSKNVNESAFDRRMIRPSGVLPFKITKNKAVNMFKAWIGKGRLFRPSKLGKLARMDGINSVYLPFWTYDANTASSWHADAGYYYYESQTFRDRDGNVQTRQVQKTRWVPVSGYYEHYFNDVLVGGSHGLKQKEVEKISPYELKDVVNYDSRFILGHESEVYQKDVYEGYKIADHIMDNEIRKQCSRMVPGDTQRNLRINTRKSKVTFKHLLLPVWIAAYQFKGKIYRFIVNGQTGKVSGKKPVSWGKVIIAILIATGVIGALVWLLNNQGGG